MVQYLLVEVDYRAMRGNKMKNIRILTLSFVAMLASSSCALSQEVTQKELTDEINRLEFMFYSAQLHIKADNQLEVHAEQRDQFDKLTERRKLLNEQRRAIFAGPQEGRIEKLKAVRDALGELDRQLKEDILLPHQVVLLGHKEFEQLLLNARGNFAKVIKTYYEDEFQLSAEQEEKLENLNKETEKKLRELAAEYAKQVDDVKAEAHQKLGNIFTLKQRARIEELSGKKFSQTEQ